MPHSTTPFYSFSSSFSAVLLRYMGNEFNPSIGATIGMDFSLKIVDLENGKVVKAQIWDTGGAPDHLW